MSDLPLPTVPSTVYAPLTQVKSADLNDYQTFMDAVKTFIETGEWTRPALTDNTPVLSTTDRDGRIRHYAGPEGYWMGPAVQRLYEGEDNETITNGNGRLLTGLYVQADASAEGSSAITETGYNFPYHEIKILSTATTDRCSIRRVPIFRELDDVCIVFEARAAMSAIGANGVDWALGLMSSYLDPPSATDAHVALVKESTDTNWQLSVSDGTTQTRIDSGVAPVANTYQTFRVEYHGANTPVGVANSTVPVARFFINGVEKAEISNANVPVTADDFLNMSMRGEGDGTGPSVDTTLKLGPIKLAYNQVLAGDIPA